MHSNNLKVEEIIKELMPLAKRQSQKFVQKYQNHQLCSIFNSVEINALAEDLMIEIATKHLNGQIDREGIFNYFKTSLKNKCTDLFIAHSKTIKRGRIQMENADVSEVDVTTQSEIDPEKLITLIHSLDSIVKQLRIHDKGNAKYSQIFELILQQRTSLEIQKELKLSSSSFDRHKHKAIELVRTIIADEHLELNLDPNVDPRFYLPSENRHQELKISPVLQSNFCGEQIRIQLKAIIQNKKERTEVIIEEYLLSKYDNEKISAAYDSLGVKGKNAELIEQLIKGF